MKDKKKVLGLKKPDSLGKFIALSVISSLPLPRGCMLAYTLYKYGKAISK